MLDSLSPRGQVAIARQGGLLATMAALWHMDVVSTPSPTCEVDALFAAAGRLTRLAEVKTRTDTLRDLRQRGSYLVTFDKLVTGRDLACQLGVEFVLIVGLRDALVWWTISDPTGDWRTSMEIRRSLTPATINGGVAERPNAYLALTGMTIEAEA